MLLFFHSWLLFFGVVLVIFLINKSCGGVKFGGNNLVYTFHRSMSHPFYWDVGPRKMEVKKNVEKLCLFLSVFPWVEI